MIEDGGRGTKSRKSIADDNVLLSPREAINYFLCLDLLYEVIRSWI